MKFTVNTRFGLAFDLRVNLPINISKPVFALDSLIDIGVGNFEIDHLSAILGDPGVQENLLERRPLLWVLVQHPLK